MTTTTVVIRAAAAADTAAIARIYNEGIEDRIATFETRLRTPADIQRRLDTGERLLVAERAGSVVGFAGWAPYSDREAYAGVGNYTVYVARSARGSGIGTLLMGELIAEAEAAGLWKLLSVILATNAPSIALAHRHGFRDVGIQRRHGRLDGEWRDALLVERLLGPADDD